MRELIVFTTFARLWKFKKPSNLCRDQTPTVLETSSQTTRTKAANQDRLVQINTSLAETHCKLCGLQEEQQQHLHLH